MVNPSWIKRLLIALAVVLVVWLWVTVFGPLDTFRRLHASAVSPDGEFAVRVYRQKGAPPPAPNVVVRVEVSDRQGRVIHREVIGGDGHWGELNNLFREITFVGDEIRIGPKFSWTEFHAIKRSTLIRQ